MKIGQILHLLVSLVSLGTAECQFQKKRVNESKKLTYVFLAALLAAVFFCLMYCMQKVCPRVDMYSPLELDEIRLERAQGREGVLAERIDRMKTKLSNLRKSRTQVQTRRDIAASIEDRVDKFNSKGRSIYGDAWEGQHGAVPIRELVKIPESDVRAMQLEAQAIVTARKQEEKQDLWDLWNKDDVELGGSSVLTRGSGHDGAAVLVSHASRGSSRPSTTKKVNEAPPSRPPPRVKPPPPALSSGGAKRSGSKPRDASDDDDCSSGQAATGKKVRSAPAPPPPRAPASLSNTIGGDGGAPLALNRSKVKVPVQLMKKNPPLTAGLAPPAGAGVSNRKPPPPIAPPPGPPPSHAARSSSTSSVADRKFK